MKYILYYYSYNNERGVKNLPLKYLNKTLIDSILRNDTSPVYYEELNKKYKEQSFINMQIKASIVYPSSYLDVCTNFNIYNIIS